MAARAPARPRVIVFPAHPLRWLAPVAAALLVAAACEASDGPTNPGGAEPPPPRELQAHYHAHAVHLSWSLDPEWDGEPFRIYGKRAADAEFLLVAEVTNCAQGRCSYTDINVAEDVTYQYYVTSVHRTTGVETASEVTVEVHVPMPDPPPAPEGLDAVPLDGAVFLRWDDASRQAENFLIYRVYMEVDNGVTFYLGETDAEGFLDLLAQNGTTYRYFVTAVDEQGHESDGSTVAEATPRPDYHGELLYAFGDRPDLSGFRFQDSELLNPVVPGDSPERDVHFEVDGDGWWLVPGPGVQIHRERHFTTALRCGPAADAGCEELRVAPASNYGEDPVELVPEHSYVVRVPANGAWHYGVIRVTHVGLTQEGAVLLFDWAFQLQPGNRALMPGR